MADYFRGIRDMKIAPWLGENSYGTAYDVLGARNMSVSWVLEGDELRGDDEVLDRFSKIISVTITLEQAAVSIPVLEMLTGGTIQSNAEYEDLYLAPTDEVPYVAIAGRVVGSGLPGDLHIFVPKAKIAGNIGLSAQLDTYILPNVELQGVREGDMNATMRMRKFPAATALEIPLRITSGGL